MDLLGACMAVIEEHNLYFLSVQLEAFVGWPSRSSNNSHCVAVTRMPETYAGIPYDADSGI